LRRTIAEWAVCTCGEQLRDRAGGPVPRWRRETPPTLRSTWWCFNGCRPPRAFSWPPEGREDHQHLLGWARWPARATALRGVESGAWGSPARRRGGRARDPGEPSRRLVVTEMNADAVSRDERTRSVLARMCRSRRTGRVDEMARSCVYLASRLRLERQTLFSRRPLGSGPGGSRLHGPIAEWSSAGRESPRSARALRGGATRSSRSFTPGRRIKGYRGLMSGGLLRRIFVCLHTVWRRAGVVLAVTRGSRWTSRAGPLGRPCASRPAGRWTVGPSRARSTSRSCRADCPAGGR